MSRRLVFVAALTMASLAQVSTAHAQRGYNRNGPAMTPDGPVYNPTSSPDYQLWARNPAAYEQLMYQRQMQYNAQQMAAYQKQQAAFQKWLKDQKAKKDKGQPTDPAYDQMLKVQAAQEAAALKAQAKIEAKKAAAQAKKDKLKAKKAAGSTAASSTTSSSTTTDAPATKASTTTSGTDSTKKPS